MAAAISLLPAASSVQWSLVSGVHSLRQVFSTFSYSNSILASYTADLRGEVRCGESSLAHRKPGGRFQPESPPLPFFSSHRLAFFFALFLRISVRAVSLVFGGLCRRKDGYQRWSNPLGEYTLSHVEPSISWYHRGHLAAVSRVPFLLSVDGV